MTDHLLVDFLWHACKGVVNVHICIQMTANIHNSVMIFRAYIHSASIIFLVTLYTVLYHCSLCYNHCWLERAVMSLLIHGEYGSIGLFCWQNSGSMFFSLASPPFIKQLMQLDSTVIHSSKMWCTSIIWCLMQLIWVFI